MDRDQGPDGGGSIKRWFRLQPPALQEGKMGYILLWLLGVPIPILLLIYLLRGCS